MADLLVSVVFILMILSPALVAHFSDSDDEGQ